MAKNKISEYSSTSANNTDVGNINIAEGCSPANLNNAIRTVMAQLKDFQTGAGGDSLTVGGNLDVSGTLAVTGATNLTGLLTGVNLTTTGNTTLGNASTDTLTITSAAVSTPNGLNFDANTLVIDATNNRVGIAKATPTTALDVTGTVTATTFAGNFSGELTGTINSATTATTQLSTDNSTKVATTAFVTAKVGTLGTLASQNSNSVSITGGSITGITDLAVADGGTGASSITANSIILGNGASALSGNLVAPSTAGNVLASNGTTWVSSSTSNGVGTRTVSTSAPTGGANGDIWYRY